MSTFAPKVGDRLILRHLRSRTHIADTQVTVTKIGRKWGYAEQDDVRWPIPRKFDLATGYVDAGEYSATERLMTVEMDAEEKRHAEVVDALKAHGITPGASGRFTQSTDTLAAILAILEDD